MSIWKKLPRPIRILAPMEDVTDTVFRRMLARLGPPDLFFTEFLRADLLDPQHSRRMQKRLEFSEHEQPIIAQIWGRDPRSYVVAARRLRGLGYNGLDINMGCPAPKLVKKGCCAGLIATPLKAAELYYSAREGADDLPVSIKTRIGLEERETEDWISFLLELRPDALTVHGRTAAEMSESSADWNEIALAVELRNRISPETVLVGNGDIASSSEIQHAAEHYGVDGVMVGRGIFHNLLLFSNTGVAWHELSRTTRLSTFIDHIRLHRDYWQNERNFEIIKKFARSYLHGLSDFEELYYGAMEHHDHDSLCEFLYRAMQCDHEPV